MADLPYEYGRMDICRIRSAAVKRALDALALAGIASRRGRGDWYISDPLLARYIREALVV
jgi:hypothetical protein